MNDFAILNSRKRALIALIHSFVFLGVAIHGFSSYKAGIIVPAVVAPGDIVLILVYLVVASVLGWLAALSRCARERLYFVLCACSASSGLLRTVFGDSAFPAAQFLRVILLASAVLVGVSILRYFHRPIAADILSE